MLEKMKRTDESYWSQAVNRSVMLLQKQVTDRIKLQLLDSMDKAKEN